MQFIQNNIQGNSDMFNQQLTTTDQQRDLGVIITRLQVAKTNSWRQAVIRPTEYWGSLQGISGTKTYTNQPIEIPQSLNKIPQPIQIPNSSTSRICSAIMHGPHI